MSQKEIRVALIGNKFMGVAHSNAFRNASMWTDIPVKITMKCLCADDSVESLKEFAQKFGWEQVETNWRKVVTRDDIDLVSIATPNFLHKEIAVVASQNGKHVFCEKPLANNLDEAKSMLNAVSVRMYI